MSINKSENQKNQLLFLLTIALFISLPVRAQVTIGSQDAPHSFSILELSTSEKKGGLRLPQLTTDQREEVANVWKNDANSANEAKGLVIFNIDTGCFEFWNGSAWISLCTSTPALTVNQTSLAFDHTGSLTSPETNTVTVTTNQNGWSIDPSSLPEWITISNTSGINGDSFTVTVSVNTSATESRETEIVVTAGNLTQTINVVQFSLLTGSGTAVDPYLILTPEQLDAVRVAPAASYKVGQDIDLTSYLAPGGDGYQQWGARGWMPLGDADSAPFTGSIDGDGYTISGLWLERSVTGSVPVGLFGYITSGGTVKNMNIQLAREGDGSKINGIHGGPNTFVGGVAGRVYGAGSTISNCKVTGDGQVNGSNSVGGVVGRVDIGASITGCYASVAINGNNGVGGVVGMVSSSETAERVGSMTNCYATGNVSGTTGVGGVVGRVGYSGTVTNCYATGAISRSASTTAINYLGGVVGRLDNNGTASNCVALNSSVTTTTGSSAFVGRVSPNKDGTSSVLSNNWALSSMIITDGAGTAKTPLNNAANGLDGMDVNATDSKTQSWWTTNLPTWDFTNIWQWDSTINLPVLK